MARIVLAVYMVRYPLGGMLSWGLQWASGLAKEGHDVWLVERADYPNACFDPRSSAMSDDPTEGMAVCARLLDPVGLGDRLAFVDFNGTLHATGEIPLSDVFTAADLHVDIGNHGAWLPQAREHGIRSVAVDGEPFYTQVRRSIALAAGREVPLFDKYFTNGANLGRPECCVPTLGLDWKHVFNPVDLSLFAADPGEREAPFTTVMNWQSHAQLTYEGTVYGQKDVEFEKFVGLPARTGVGTMEIAVAGAVPKQRMIDAGWEVVDGHQASASFDTYREYIARSAGEFAVCKQGYVSANTGWFSDRSAAYLGSGRPVVIQDTGLNGVLPTGRGLFAVRDVEDAAAAICEIRGDYARQAQWARELAREFLATEVVVPAFLEEACSD